MADGVEVADDADPEAALTGVLEGEIRDDVEFLGDAEELFEGVSALNVEVGVDAVVRLAQVIVEYEFVVVEDVAGGADVATELIEDADGAVR